MATISLGGGPSLEERRGFAGLREGTHVPGYRGYCPQIKYRVGKTYGGDTHELNQLYEHKKSGMPSAIAPDTARPILANRLPEPSGDRKYTRDMMPGYTGYIPRRPYRFGGTYKEDCDVCIDEHLTNMQSHSSKIGQLRNSVQGYPRLEPIKRDQKDVLRLYTQSHPNQPPMLEDKRPLLEPPMPGYQGYIPRINTTELGLGVRYYQSTKNGLEAFKAETDQREVQLSAPVVVNRSFDGQGLAANRRLYPTNGMIPKYTGYIPQKRYHFGQTYGNTTRSLDVCAHTQGSFGEHNKVAQSMA